MNRTFEILIAMSEEIEICHRERRENPRTRRKEEGRVLGLLIAPTEKNLSILERSDTIVTN